LTSPKLTTTKEEEEQKQQKETRNPLLKTFEGVAYITSIPTK